LLMQLPQNSEHYALKILSKEQIVKEDLGLVVQNERSIMALLDSPFVVKCFRSYYDNDYYYFLLECVFGGELFDVFMEHNLFRNIPCAKFYIACITLGLQHLHMKRIIYRDLKLENCLLGTNGYVKLTDMGIAKLVMGKTYTVCGTADYFAPETLRQTGYNRAVDWWALGVLLFMMGSGTSPFDSSDVTQIYKNIIKGFSKVTFPTHFTSDLTDTIKSLCRKKPEERIPMQKGGVDNLKGMPFFTGLDWSKLAKHECEPPLTPEPLSKEVFEKFAAKKLSVDVEFNSKTLNVWDGT
jgi:serine/threonine protein kinase